ncbi:AraC family transcriptional regulator [Roseobacter sp.]|uniref:AraC family transcriptional regulator n=1 Tax=Roseobacter sp. TaxID=1907202 RepID=UPI002966CE6C|nr:AraC family transcriptional regulator [Roseobacter sp.]MDW3181469.1 AraC family transcriptional regulator [Roseobacter sp.]
MEQSHPDNRFWTDRNLSDLEFFSAKFKKHKYRRHSHFGYVIGVVVDGAEAFFCRGEIHTAGPGDIILVNPQSQHDGEAATELGWAYRVIYPREDHFLALANTTSPPRFVKSVVHDPELSARIVGLHQAAETKSDLIDAQFAWADILFQLVARHSEAKPTECIDRQDAKRIAMIEEILRAQAVIGVSLEAVAAQVGCSQWHLVRSFTRAKGISPHAFLLDCRLRHAKSLIDAGEPLAMASAAAGFVDQSHFTRHFVRAYGFTPGRYQAIRAP